MLFDGLDEVVDVPAALGGKRDDRLDLLLREAEVRRLRPHPLRHVALRRALLEQIDALAVVAEAPLGDGVELVRRDDDVVVHRDEAGQVRDHAAREVSEVND